MLIQFLVENFLSFKDETVFSMLAPPEERGEAVVEIPAHGLRLMRIAAFYGANASGKSNLVEAMQTARELVAYEQSSDNPLPTRTFRLAAESASTPSRFQFDFILQEHHYTYIFAFTRDAIITEALYRKLPNATEEMVYEREAPANGGRHNVKFGQMLDADSDPDEDRRFARFTARGTHARQLLLTKFATSNMSEFESIRTWFQDGLTVVGAQARYANLIRELQDNNSLRAFYERMLAKIGTGINSVQVEKRPVQLRQLSLFEFAPLGGGHKFITPDSPFSVAWDDERQNILELKLAHSSRAGFAATFSLEEESDGTQRLLHLLPVLFHRTKDSGLCTIIDELDRSLHTTLTRHFVKEFLSMGSGTQTQLIFTTHDTNLLNGQLLPIPAIWFVEKDDNGASHIYSLAEYKADQIEQLLEHLEEGYLQGRFGAIPFIADRNNLRWQVREEKPAQ